MTESSVSRDQRDSDDDWEEKEASRTHFVKFTDDASDAREVSLHCCRFISKRNNTRMFTCHALDQLRCRIPPSLRVTSEVLRASLRRRRIWLRRNVWEKCTRQRAYMALGALFVALE